MQTNVSIINVVNVYILKDQNINLHRGNNVNKYKEIVHSCSINIL